MGGSWSHDVFTPKMGACLTTHVGGWFGLPEGPLSDRERVEQPLLLGDAAAQLGAGAP
jgi:hypothetical protein